MYLPVRLPPLPFLSPPAVGPIRAIKLQTAYLRQLQRLCEGDTPHTGLALVAALLAHLEVRVLFSAADLRALPATGAFLAFATQPGSLIQQLVLLHVLGQARPEVRALLSEALAPPPSPLLAHCLALPPTPDGQRSQTPGWRRLLRLLHNEVPVVLMADANAPLGAAFSGAAERLLTTLRVPVVPIGLSSRAAAPLAWWQALPTLLYPLAGVARELLSERGTTFRVRLGPAVGAAVVQGLPVAARLPYLQAKAEALRTAGPVAAHPPLAAAAALPGAADYQLLEADLAALRPQCRVVQCRQWEVYVAKGQDIPQVLREIRRLRALTLEPASAAGQPTPGQQDLADASYRHLFIYNRRARQLVGACRLGHGKTLLQRYGHRGFQLYTPFKLRHELHPLLQQALELSQAFVCADYQGQLLPLGLLWEGLAQYLRARPQYRYLLGSTNLSHCYAALPKATVAEFIEQHCLAPETAAYVRTRRSFRYQELPGLPRRPTLPDDFDHEQLLHDLLAHPEPGGLGVPPRLRPYFRQQARFIGLHLDPVSGTLRGALVLDASKLADYTYRLGEREE